MRKTKHPAAPRCASRCAQKRKHPVAHRSVYKLEFIAHPIPEHHLREARCAHPTIAFRHDEDVCQAHLTRRVPSSLPPPLHINGFLLLALIGVLLHNHCYYVQNTNIPNSVSLIITQRQHIPNIILLLWLIHALSLSPSIRINGLLLRGAAMLYPTVMLSQSHRIRNMHNTFCSYGS